MSFKVLLLFLRKLASGYSGGKRFFVLVGEWIIVCEYIF